MKNRIAALLLVALAAVGPATYRPTRPPHPNLALPAVQGLVWHEVYPEPRRPRARPRSKPRASRTVWRQPASYTAWASSRKTRRLRHCESTNNYQAVSPNGIYRGAYQADASFWKTYGGLQFAPSPDLAKPWQQDLVAYRGFKARGWEPWECRSKIGG